GASTEMVEPFERELRAGKCGVHAGTLGDYPHACEGNTGLPLKGQRGVGIELRRERGEELEILASLSGELMGRDAESAAFVEAGRGHGHRVELELDRDFRRLSQMTHVPTKAVTQIEHCVSAHRGEPAACIDTRERVSNRVPRLARRLAAPVPGLECRA